MAGKIGFWTRSKLVELAGLSKTMSTMELAKHYDREVQAIIDALAFYHQNRKLKRKTIKRKKYTITIYKAGYARGTIPVSNDESDDDDSGLV